MKRTIVLLGCVAIGFSIIATSCQVFVDFGLKDTTQELYDARIPQLGPNNTLPGILPGYEENNPAYRYRINFFGNDKCVATYYAADTVNYEVEGTWSLPNHDVLRIDLDQYVDGDFKMIKLEKDIFFLSTDNNYIEAFDSDSVPFQMYIRRIQ